MKPGRDPVFDLRVANRPKCHPRKRFANQAACKAAAGRIMVTNTSGAQLYTVPCQHCNGWHLG